MQTVWPEEESSAGQDVFWAFLLERVTFFIQW